MQHRHLISLLQEHYTTVKCEFQVGSRCYTFKVSRETAATLKEGDLVVVAASENSSNSTFGYAIVRVKEIDNEPDIDLDANYAYKWIVQKIDLDSYNAQVLREKELTKKLQHLERISQRERIVKQMESTMLPGGEGQKLLNSIVEEINGSNKENTNGI